jgi:hypothetical protein
MRGEVFSMPDDHQSPTLIPRYSLKGMLLGITLIAAGLTSAMASRDYVPVQSLWPWAPLFFAGGLLTGAGIGLPFGRWLKCATIALAIQVVFVTFIVILD